MTLKSKTINFIKAFIIIIALFLLSIGAILISHGEYFYKITSKEKFGAILDEMIFEQIERQEDFKELCNYLNISCSSFEEVVKEVCEKSENIREEYENTVSSIASMLNVSKSEALSIVCTRNIERCNNLKLAKSYVEDLENLCLELKERKEEIERNKEELYEEKIINGISLKNINETLENSFSKGIVLILISVFLIYISSRSIEKIFVYIFYITLAIGIISIITFYLGNNFAMKFINENVKSKALQSFILDILTFEQSIGILFLSLGILGLISIFILKRVWKTHSKKMKTPKAQGK